MSRFLPPVPRHAIAAAALALLGLPAHAANAPVQADTYVTTASPANNFGNTANLNVAPGSLGLVRFDLSTLPAGTTAAKVVKATLLLYVNRIGIPGSVEVQTVFSAWAEATVTANTVPVTSGMGSGPTVPVTTAGQFISVDVTTQVKQWINSGGNNGFAVTPALSDPSTTVFFDSKPGIHTGGCGFWYGRIPGFT